MRKYIAKHPLSEVTEEIRWNNVPICVKQLFELVSQAIIAQDIHMWERKNLQNQRVLRLQKLCHKL